MDDTDLKSSIEAELKKASPDWHLIETLSRGAVDADPDVVRFSVDAAHIQRLGEELVAKQETALSELIKNAFDADATEVTLTFERQAKTGGVLTIVDDGLGMEPHVIRDAWMRISTASKVDDPTSPRFGRVRAGRKGIGRFAVQRLGKRLTLVTRPAGSSTGFRVTFDWEENFRPGRDIQDIFSGIQRFEKPLDQQGTTLIIEDLRDAWSNVAIERVWRSVILLQPPFEIRPVMPLAEVGQQADPGFRVVINGTTQAEQTRKFSIESEFLPRATAVIAGSVKADGRAVVTVRSAKLDLDDAQDFDVDVGVTGPFAFEARYFIYTPDMLSGMKLGAAIEMGRLFGGIRVYRNGFRVLPYGEGRNDWLGLDDISSRRNLLVAINNRNFFGQVRLDSNTNPAFEETSSREGLLENDAFDALRDFIQKALIWAAGRVGSIRQRKVRAGQRDFVSTARPSQLIRELRENSGGGGTDSGSTDDWRIIEEAAADFERKVEADRAASLEYEEMLRILASLGISISVFGHEVKGAQDNVAAHVEVLRQHIASLADPYDKKMLSSDLAGLAAASDRLLDVGGYIASLMSSTESRELRPLSVRGSLDRFTRQFDDYMRKQKIEFTVDVQPSHLRTAPMHSSELDSVLLNLLTNSIKSMRKAKVADRRVRIEARKVDRQVVIGFEDNGEGIPPENRERVFDAFFTTTTGAEDDGVAGPGTGLGLKIVSDVATSYGGIARVAEPSPGYTCRVEFTVLDDSQAEAAK